MTYTFARICAALKLRVADYQTLGRRAWLRLEEKGGKTIDLPRHQSLEDYLVQYIATADIAEDKKGLLFCSLAG